MVDEVARRAARQLDDVVRDIRLARHAAGLSQAAIARALRCSPQLISALERRGVEPSVVQLVRWAATVGLEVPIRAFVGGRRLHDAGQLRVLGRLRHVTGETWRWATEVAVSADPRERRAFDAVLSRGRWRIGVEAIVRLTDAQSQVRAVTLKQEAAGITRVVVVLADSVHNRRALRDAHPTFGPAFPLSPRETMRALREGSLPEANGVVFV